MKRSLAPVASANDVLNVVCIGAHSDDLEIGCGGTVLRWLREYTHVDVLWIVASAVDTRGQEAMKSVRSLLRRARSKHVMLGDFRDAYFPADYARLKAFLAEASHRADPDVVFTHRLEDRHQDHRLIAELTWQLWRNHTILEYETPKYEADLGSPNLYVPLEAATAHRKLRHMQTHFASQNAKPWFDNDVFKGLLRLRGLECNSPSGFAEGFYARKLIV